MNTISIEDAHYFLSQCAGVLLEGRYIEPLLFDIEGDYDNEWLILEWDEIDEEGEEGIVTISFLEKENQKILLEGSKMTLISQEEEEEEIILLKEWKPLINS